VGVGVDAECLEEGEDNEDNGPFSSARVVRRLVKLTSVPEGEGEVDECLFTEGFSGTVVLLDEVVDLAHGRRDESVR
jgi:hypothetical protein